MGKTVLIAGKDSPDGKKLADGFAFTGRQIALTSADLSDAYEDDVSDDEKKASLDAYDEVKSIEAKSGMCTYEWNRSSPVSARTLILQTENTYSRLDEVILYFDEEWFASQEDKIDSERIARAADEMVLGFQYLAMESLARFEKKNSASNPGTLVFLLKEGYTASDALKTPALRNGLSAIASPVVAAAEASFTAFAENLTALYGDMPYVNIVLVREEKSGDTSLSDEALGKWLGNYLEAVENLKTKTPAKKALQWVKSGSKAPSGTFNLFSRR